jgi:hypothetical protein
MKLALLCIFCFVWYNLSAQSGFGTFIGAAKDDPAVSMFDLQVQYLNDKPYRLAPVQKLELQNRK